MLINFSLENWMSFHKEVSFSMIASRERQQGHRVANPGKSLPKILPVATIFGGNASGKTNFFKALSFIKNFVVLGPKNPKELINVDPFRLGPNGEEQKTRFSLTILINKTIYDFSFTVTSMAVLEEKLVSHDGNKSKVLYHRCGDTPNFHSSLKENLFLDFAFRGTQDNQLFLTNSISQKIANFREVYDWFDDSLQLAAPDSRFGPFELFFAENNPRYKTLNELFSELDTGISHLGGDIIPINNLPFPEAFLTELKKNVSNGMAVLIIGGAERFVVTRNNGELVAKILVTYHQKHDGSEIKFNFSQESAGSLRLIELLPTFIDLSDESSKKVYIFDDLDRSLHHALTHELLMAYLSSCSTKTRKQLIFTSHDVLLMTKQLFRRDEIWLTEINSEGSSNMISLSDYKDIRFDKDIQKSYLLGSFGGIPNILSANAMAHTMSADKSRA